MEKKDFQAIVREAYNELQKLNPTTEEIQAYAELHTERGIVTHGEDKGELRLSEPWWPNGRGVATIEDVYIELGRSTHLKLNANHAPEFVQFIKQGRKAVS
jgi:hypothetical protein